MSNRVDRPAAAAVLQQLSAMLESDAFRQAPRLSRLLRYLVDRTLAGEGDELKEYALGVDVFDRDETFDPRQDTIVRVQVRRLRARLDDYYRSDGRHDPLFIEIPTGRYAAVFSRTPRAPRRPVGRRGDELALEQFSLPAPRTSIIGREADLATLDSLLRSGDGRIVTLSGPGGSGKTRLAIEVARKVTDAFPGGVHLVALAPVSDPSDVVTMFARALRMSQSPGVALADGLVHHVREALKEPTLLVADNFEHLLPAAPVVARLLEATECLTILVTSREVLHIYGEYEYPVEPLAVPTPADRIDTLGGNPAVALFVSCARKVVPSFALTVESAPIVVDICRRLDGLPLGIELAAARLRLLTIGALRDRLADSIDVLSDGPRDAPARQRTLRATIDWSYELLSEPEQRLFRRLSVCAGGCTREGAEAIGNARRDLGADVMATLDLLVEKNLLRQSALQGDRLEMLDTLRTYGLEKLAEGEDALLTRRAHAAYAMVIAEEGMGLPGEAQQSAWLHLCDAEYGNLRAALDWLLATHRIDWALRLFVALIPFWDRRELPDEARRRVDALLKLRPAAATSRLWVTAVSYSRCLATDLADHATSRQMNALGVQLARALGDDRTEVQVLNTLASYERFVGDYDAAREHWERAVDLCRGLGERAELAAAISNLAGAVRRLGDLDRARALLAECRELFRDLGDELGVAWALNHLGDVEYDAGDLAGAERLYRDALDRFGRVGDVWAYARVSADLGLAVGAMGRHAEARELLVSALCTFDSLGHRRGVARLLEGLAEVALTAADPGRALTLAGAAAAVRRDFPGTLRPAEEARLDEVLTGAWQACDESHAEACWLAGTRMADKDAIRFALG